MYSYPQCYQILTKYKQYFGRGVVLLFLLTNWLRQVEAEELGRSSRLLSPHPRTYTDTKSIRRRLGNAGTFATQCQPGQYVTADNLCENCGQGKFERDGECIPCLQGKYGEKEGQTSCSTCSAGRTTSQSLGSTTESDCDTGCSPGEAWSDCGMEATCMECPAGKFSSSSEATSCGECGPGTFYSGEFQDEPGNTGCNTCSGGESGTNTIGATSEGEACSDASNLPLVLGPAIAGPCCCLLIPFLLWRRKKKKKEKELEEELRNDYEIPERRRRMVSSGIPGTTGVINPLAGSGTDDGCTSKGSSSMLAATVIPPRHQNGDEEEHARDPYGDKKGFGPISSRNLVVDPNKSEPNSSPTAAKISSTGYSSD